MVDPPSLHPARVSSRVVGRYELLVRIASGGMSTVYLARVRGAAGFERLFAVKLCHPHLLEDRSFVEMFLDEARLAALIRHPSVVPTVDLGTEEQLFLVMEYVEGGALSRLMQAAQRTEGRRLPTAVTLRITLDALAGLHAAHEVRASNGRPLHLVHRDLSPHNVLVGVDGLSRITDFGIARAEARLHHTTGTTLKGKLAYMSPEQVQGKGGEVDRRADIFSAGVVLWEALTGRRLFAGDSQGAIAHAVIEAPIPAPSMVNPEVDRRLDPVLLRALERDPARRFAEALELAESIEATGLPAAPHREVGDTVRRLLVEDLQRLEAALAAEPEPAPAPTPSVAVRGKQPQSSQRRLLWLAVALSAAALVAVALSLWLASSPPVEGDASAVRPQTRQGEPARRKPDAEPAASQPTASRPAVTPRIHDIRRRRPRRRPRPRERKKGPPKGPNKKTETYRPDRI
jgi:serine/threonine-protein kinase